ncbi:cyclic nucleotide-binding domain-containing protein [Mycobacterium sp. 236(2023)]|uniref:cyclic nucleotide-binding domain-containing protein n=1 Tax=Mycobacterium sp. 236(2023) TaxID=3038163 RepID=UPI002414D1B7|nr:cyclic nucleotide-binding domain-containing protein [Mycobacterium sp. 236(2023)]MDG4667936.1 cyclic nucleotide-binding domain-containing protein [Mycobacterium sp. 236(2023)]
MSSRAVSLLIVSRLSGSIAEWMWYSVATVFAFSLGGVGAIGAIGVASVLPAGMLGPAVGYIIDRYRRERVLALMLGLRFLAVGFTVVSAALFPSVAVLVVVAVVEGIATLFVRPTCAALLPSVTTRPEQLIRAYAWLSASENVGVLVGPVAGGLMLAATTPAIAMSAAALFALGSAAAAAIVRVAASDLPPVIPGSGLRRAVAEVISGTRAIAQRDVRAVALITMLGFAALGASEVFVIPLAIETLGWGDAGPGVLLAGVAAGGLLAGAALGAIGRRRLGPWFVFATLVTGLGLGLTAAVPHAVLVLAASIAFGAGAALVTTASQVQIQGLVPLSSSGRVLGTLEGAGCLATAAGVWAAAYLIDRWSVSTSLYVLGVAAAVGAIALALPVLRTDARVAETRERIEALDGVALFDPLPNSLRDRLASQIEPLDVAAGEVVIHQGEYGDAFYVVEDGELEVYVDRRFVRSLGPDDFFGELALLADGPRTATVRATTNCLLWTLPRNAFLAILTGFPATSQVIEAASSERTAHLPAPADHLTALSQVPLLAALDAETIDAVAGGVTVRRCEHSSVIFRENDFGDDAYFVVSGQVRMERAESLVRTITAGQLFGEYTALRPGTPRSATATATSGTVLLQIPGAPLRAALS